MRMRRTSIALGGLLGGLALVGSGCLDALGDFYLPLTDPALATGGSSGSSSASATSGSSGTGGAPPSCDGDPSAENVIDACGVFVRADAAGATEDGTEAHPYKTLQKAVDNAGGKRVYACGSAPYSEAVTITSPVEVYGGFDCTKGWGWTADARSALNGPAGAVALTLTKQGEGSRIEGFAITAANATAKGESSVAVTVDDITAELMSCQVTAGDGMPGDDGVAPGGLATKGMDAPPPDAATMNACINPAAVAGGIAGTSTCDDGVTAGGKGGKGGINSDGSMGDDGTPADAVKGKGGTGEDAMSDCTDGGKGKSGSAGLAGNAGSAPGALSLKGIADSGMTDGNPGARGTGGGGGGGSKSGLLLCQGGVDGNGASGGGGGAGGCAGKGGGGGKAGGSSIGIVSLGTKLVLTNVSLKTGTGSAGGKGVGGQGGGAVGAGAFGGAGSGTVKPGCKGGDGGLGGAGGPGGGGRGGHSVGIAYPSAPLVAPMVKSFMGGMAGLGGKAGPGNATGDGSKGAEGACWDFGKNASCGQ